MVSMEYSTKSERVYFGVRDGIVSGKIMPGERLLISAVAKEYGISEIPVREAFRTLTQEGFLNSKPNAGFVVSQISRKEVNDIFRVRVELESLAVREAIRNITEEGVNELFRMVDDSEKFIPVSDFGAYWLANREWHFALYRHSNNDVLMRMLTELFDYSCRYPAYYTRREELSESVESHRQILEAVLRKDAGLADALIRSHTIKTGYHYIARLEETLGDKLLD